MTHPALSSLLLTLPYDVDGARAALGPAREAVTDAAVSLEPRAAAVVQRDGGNLLIDELRGLYSRLTSLIDQIETGNLMIHDELRASIDALEAATQRLEEHERTQPRHSPIPLLDRFIVSGFNVRDGFVPPALLNSQIPDVIRTVELLTADGVRFRALYPEASAIADRYERDLRAVQAGVNAARAYTVNPTDQVLLDALRLLGNGSTALISPLQEMDAHARNFARFSRTVAVEETLRCAEGVRNGSVPPDVFIQAAGHLDGLADFLVGAAAAGAAFPLAFAIRTYIVDLEEQSRLLRAVEAPWFARATVDPRAAAADLDALERIRAAAEAAVAAQDRLQKQIDELLALFDGAPQLLDVVANVAGVGSGRTLAEDARQRSSEFVERAQSLQDEIGAQSPGPSSFEARALLAEQIDAVSAILPYIDDRDERHLREGLQMLRQILPQLNTLQRELRAGADAQREARERVVSCFRCGASNPVSNRYCGGCNAVLPSQVAEETVYTDIVGGEEQPALPENLQTLQNLYTRAEAGADSDLILSELAAIYDRLSQVAREHAQAAPTNDVAREYAEAFSAHLARLIEAVEVMHNGAQASNLDYMGHGLQAALHAGQEMQALQLHMQENASL